MDRSDLHVVTFIIFSCAVFLCESINKITECGLKCSQGLQCKSKPSTFFYNNVCQSPPVRLSPSVLQDMHISTVMTCRKDRDCSLHLNIKGTLTLDESIRGVEICSLSVDTLRKRCTAVTFPKNAGNKFHGKKVLVQYNCFEVNIAQQVHVSLKTIPYYCGVMQKQDFYVEDCSNEDLGKHIPICIAGKLNYTVHQEKKAISVQVSEFLENHDYHVRLCHKWFTCEETGTSALIKKEDRLKKVTLPFSELLPCLCVEGWSAIQDARRIRLCPFTNHTEELWKGITYNPISQELVWKPSCPIHVNVSLCWATGVNDLCIDLPNTSHKAQGKVKYSRVDTHPRLCMKFSNDKGTWVRCPFVHGVFPAWGMNIEIMSDHLLVSFTSQVKARFSVLLCNGSALSTCQPIDEEAAVIDKSFSGNGTVRISKEICGPNVCIKGFRIDADYSVPVEECNIPCTLSPHPPVDNGKYLQMITITAIVLILVTMLALIGHIVLTVFHRRKSQFKRVFKSQVQHMSLNAGL